MRKSTIALRKRVLKGRVKSAHNRVGLASRGDNKGYKTFCEGFHTSEWEKNVKKHNRNTSPAEETAGRRRKTYGGGMSCSP